MLRVTWMKNLTFCPPDLHVLEKWEEEGLLTNLPFQTGLKVVGLSLSFSVLLPFFVEKGRDFQSFCGCQIRSAEKKEGRRRVFLLLQILSPPRGFWAGCFEKCYLTKKRGKKTLGKALFHFFFLAGDLLSPSLKAFLAE